MTPQPFAAEIAKIRAAVGEPRKPLAVVKRERTLREVRAQMRAAEDAQAARCQALQRAAGGVPDSDPYFDVLTGRVKTAEPLVREAARALDVARTEWAPKAHADAQCLVDEARPTIDAMLDALEQATAPLAALADHCVSSGIAEPPAAAKVREVWLHAHAARRCLAETMVRLVRVRFVEAMGEYKPGQVVELPADSARHYAVRGVAIDADAPWTPPTMVRVRMVRDIWVGRGRTHIAGQEYEVAEPTAMTWIEAGRAVAVDPTIMDKLFGATKAALAPAIEAVGQAIEVGRGAPRQNPL